MKTLTGAELEGVGSHSVQNVSVDATVLRTSGQVHRVQAGARKYLIYIQKLLLVK